MPKLSSPSSRFRTEASFPFRSISRPPTDQVYLILLGTGIRNAGTTGVSVKVQGLNALVTYAGPQSEVPGLDQVNVLLPRELAGSGPLNVVLTAAPANANTVHLSIK